MSSHGGTMFADLSLEEREVVGGVLSGEARRLVCMQKMQAAAELAMQ